MNVWGMMKVSTCQIIGILYINECINVLRWVDPGYNLDL